MHGETAVYRDDGGGWWNGGGVSTTTMGSALPTAGFHEELAPLKFSFLSPWPTSQYSSKTLNLSGYRTRIVNYSRPFLSSSKNRFRRSLAPGFASRLLYSK